MPQKQACSAKTRCLCSFFSLYKCVSVKDRSLFFLYMKLWVVSTVFLRILSFRVVVLNLKNMSALVMSQWIEIKWRKLLHWGTLACKVNTSRKIRKTNIWECRVKGTWTPRCEALSTLTWKSSRGFLLGFVFWCYFLCNLTRWTVRKFQGFEIKWKIV